MSKYQILQIDFNEYSASIGGMERRNIFVDPLYLEGMMKAKRIEFYKVTDGSGDTAVFPLNIIRKGFVEISLPPPFTPYFNILTKPAGNKERGRMRFYEACEGAYAEWLRRRFAYFSIPQSPEQNDSRHFSWSGCRVKPRYTYLLENAESSLESADRMVRNKPEAEYSEEYDFEMHHRMIAEAYKSKPPMRLSEYVKVMEIFKQNGILKCFSSNDGHVTFLMDNERKTAYAYNICGRNTAGLIFTALKREIPQGYMLDFHGANTKRISNYKSMFNPVVKGYFCIEGFHALF